MTIMDDLSAQAGCLDVGPCVVSRKDRALLEVTGEDRLAWLHNLTTNQVRTLFSGDGNYAFVLNLQGRILFDLNLMVLSDRVWIDLDCGFLEVALSHFDKYRITEDVCIDRIDSTVTQFALVGESCIPALSDLGASHMAKMSQTGTTEVQWKDASVRIMRNDFCGPFAVTIFVSVDQAKDLWQFLVDPDGPVSANEASLDAVHVRRIENGIPWSRAEIVDEYLPAETGQLERAVSFQKGCYLGQEVVERMRSRGVQARKLVGLTFGGESPFLMPAELLSAEGQTVGAVTSLCPSKKVGGVIGLGYVKLAHAESGTALKAIGKSFEAQAKVVDLPFGA